MYTEFNVKNYKSLRDLSVALSPTTLILGRNNVGKTSLLEAVWIHFGYDISDLWVRTHSFRGHEITRNLQEFFGQMVNRFDPQSQIELSAKGDWGHGSRTLYMKLEPREQFETNIEPPPTETMGKQRTTGIAKESAYQVALEYLAEDGLRSKASTWVVEEQLSPTVFGVALRSTRIPHQSSIRRPIGIFQASRTPYVERESADRVSAIATEKQTKVLLDFLRVVEPRIQDIRTHTEEGKQYPEVDIGEPTLVPAALMGGGFIKLLDIGTAAHYSRRGGIVLIDEIENGLHHQTLPQVWKGIGALGKAFGVQFIATTHSLECVSAAYQAFSEEGADGFLLQRLQRRDGRVESVKFDIATLGAALDAGLEVR